MIVENVDSLKIHKLTQEQYNTALSAGSLDENALYLTPDSDGTTIPTKVSDLENDSGYATQTYVDEAVAGVDVSLDNATGVLPVANGGTGVTTIEELADAVSAANKENSSLITKSEVSLTTSSDTWVGTSGTSASKSFTLQSGKYVIYGYSRTSTTGNNASYLEISVNLSNANGDSIFSTSFSGTGNSEALCWEEIDVREPMAFTHSINCSSNSSGVSIRNPNASSAIYIKEILGFYLPQSLD